MKSAASTLIIAAWVAMIANRSHASIVEQKRLRIDFTEAADASPKATWSNPDRFNISPAGLGWDGEVAQVYDGWMQTKPLAIGLSWRPTRGASIRIRIQPAPREITLSNGQKTTPYAGDVYVRYSPDLKHWSSWQALSRAEPQSTEEKREPGRCFNGTIGVPNRERSEYGRLIADYARLDVSWKSDEEAAVQWILKRDPEFFAEQIPFIGYVEFLFETGFYGGQRIKSFEAEIGYGLGGTHLPPKDLTGYDRRNIPWRFKAGNALEEAVPNRNQPARSQTNLAPAAPGGSR